MAGVRTVTTSEAKAKLNGLLAEVAAGTTYTITLHGRPVAVLSKAREPGRVFGRFAGRVAPTDDFDAPMAEDEIAHWEQRS